MNPLHEIFGFFCHQLPERSPQLGGLVFPLCFRCAGLHLGLLVSYGFLASTGGFRRRLPEARLAVGVSLLLVPFLVDGWGNTLHLWSSPGWLRALSGAAGGVALPLLLAPLMLRPRAVTPAARPTVPCAAALLVPGGFAVALVWSLAQPVSAPQLQALALAALVGLLLFATNIGLAAGTLRPAPSSAAPVRPRMGVRRLARERLARSGGSVVTRPVRRSGVPSVSLVHGRHA